MTDFINLASHGIRELQPYQPGKPVEELERELGLTDVIKLASNENPLGASSSVLESVQSSLADVARYPDGSAYLLKNKLSDFLGVATNQLTIGNGSNDVLELLARVYLSRASGRRWCTTASISPSRAARSWASSAARAPASRC